MLQDARNQVLGFIEGSDEWDTAQITIGDLYQSVASLLGYDTFTLQYCGVIDKGQCSMYLADRVPPIHCRDPDSTNTIIEVIS